MAQISNGVSGVLPLNSFVGNTLQAVRNSATVRDMLSLQGGETFEVNGRAQDDTYIVQSNDSIVVRNRTAGSKG